MPKAHIYHELSASVYLLYSAATLVTLIVLSPYFLYQALRHRKYVGSLGQRLGYLPVAFNLDGDDSIWVHAVSVGEVLAARPVIVELRKRYPTLRMFLSTTTLTGQSWRSAQRVGRGRRVLSALRLDVHDSPHALGGQAAALRDGRDRDLAEPPPPVPPAGREDDDGERARLVPILSTVSPGAARFSAACSPTWTASACRGRRPPAA